MTFTSISQRNWTNIARYLLLLGTTGRGVPLHLCHFLSAHFTQFLSSVIYIFLLLKEDASLREQIARGQLLQFIVIQLSMCLTTVLKSLSRWLILSHLVTFESLNSASKGFVNWWVLFRQAVSPGYSVHWKHQPTRVLNSLFLEGCQALGYLIKEFFHFSSSLPIGSEYSNKRPSPL